MAQTELIIIRHGETQWNSKKLIQGQLDSPLTSRGEREAFSVGYRVGGMGFDSAYSSDLGRAVQTAEIIDDALDIGVTLHKGLRELNFGIFQAMTWADAAAAYPEETKRFRSDDDSYEIPDGESWAAFYSRCVETMIEIETKHRGERTLVVCHGGVIGMLIRYVLGIPASAPRGYEIANASYNRFVVTNGHWMVHTLGDVDHLGATAYDEIQC